MCWLCTVAYKRVLAKARVREEESRKNFGSQKQSSEKPEVKQEKIDPFDAIINKSSDENKQATKSESIADCQDSSQEEKPSERKSHHKHHHHKHHKHHHHHHKHKHHHGQK